MNSPNSYFVVLCEHIYGDFTTQVVGITADEDVAKLQVSQRVAVCQSIGKTSEDVRFRYERAQVLL